MRRRIAVLVILITCIMVIFRLGLFPGSSKTFFPATSVEPHIPKQAQIIENVFRTIEIPIVVNNNEISTLSVLQDRILVNGVSEALQLQHDHTKANSNRADANGSSIQSLLNTKTKSGSIFEEYCNIPGMPNVPSLEGQAPIGYQLQSIHIMIRHGDRAPMGQTVSIGPIHVLSTSCNLDLRSAVKPDLLKQFIDKVRGKRLAGWSTPLLPSETSCRHAHLTQQGVEQQILSGMEVAKAIDRLLSLSVKEGQHRLLVSSTATERTFHSAIAFLFGLLPNLELAKITINPAHNVIFCEPSEDNFGCACPMSSILQTEADMDSKVLEAKDAAYQSVFESVQRTMSAHSYPKLHHQYPWKTFHDLTAQRLCHNITRCHRNICISDEQTDMNWESLKFYYQGISRSYAYRRLASAQMYPLIQEMTRRMERQSLSSLLDEPVVLYSGHDVSLELLLVALGLPVAQWPKYAARLVLELYTPSGEKTISHQGAIIRIVYNGQDVTGLTDFCDDKSTSCNLKDFLSYAQQIKAVCLEQPPM